MGEDTSNAPAKMTPEVNHDPYPSSVGCPKGPQEEKRRRRPQRASSSLGKARKKSTDPPPMIKVGKKEEILFFLTKIITLGMQVVVRRLSPSMTESEFLEQVSPLPEHDYFYFNEADKSLAPYAFSRAYINFVHHEDILRFRERFDGYAFVDSQLDRQFPAVVEFAPNQKVPRKEHKLKTKDHKVGTIESDLDYVKFLEEREKGKTATVTIYQQLEGIAAKEKERGTKMPKSLESVSKSSHDEGVKKERATLIGDASKILFECF